MGGDQEFRSGRAYRRVRAQVLAGRPSYCYLCQGERGPIRYDLKWPHTLSPSVDHVIPVEKARHLDRAARRAVALDPRNMRPAHLGCNSKRGDGPVPQAALAPNPSQDWYSEECA